MPHVEWKVREWNHRLNISLTDHPSDSIVDCLLFHTSVPGVYTFRCGRLFNTFSACDLESAKKIAMHTLREWLQEALCGLDKLALSIEQMPLKDSETAVPNAEVPEATIATKLPRGGWF